MTAATEAPDIDTEDHEVPDTEEARETWTIDDLGKAAWAMAKNRELALRQAEIRRIADDKIARWVEWRDQQVASLQNGRTGRDFFEAHLTAYALRRRAEDEKRNKTLTLPFGTVSTKDTSKTPKWDIDEEALIPWLKENFPRLVTETTAEKVDVKAAKKTLPAVDGTAFHPSSGATVPGITVIPGGVSANITIDLGGAS